MKIEIDTEHASKDEMKHLAALLHALSGESDRSFSMSRKSRSATPGQSGPRNIFDDPAPAGGFFSMFGDPSPATPTQSSSEQVSTVSPAPAQGASVGDMFSIFGSDPSPSAVTGASGAESYGSVAEEDETPTTAEELLDDDRIVPY
ncbi:MAG: hypothetical protein V1729_02090 [Candidatus Woesearchaeota archaeon]